MPIFQVTKDALTRLPDTSFGKEGILERKGPQRLLQQSIAALGEDLMVIAEEFGEWQESARRIDLLCLDKDAILVVVELWQDLPQRRASRIRRVIDGGYCSPREQWPALHTALVGAMIRLDKALRPLVQKLKT